MSAPTLYQTSLSLLYRFNNVVCGSLLKSLCQLYLKITRGYEPTAPLRENTRGGHKESER